MKNTYRIPADIYERVHEVMLDITNATQAQDTVLTAVYYEQLRRFCEQQTASGRGSGFLWEALADVTDDSAERRMHYERALSLARQNSEPTDTILLELRHLSHTVAQGRA